MLFNSYVFLFAFLPVTAAGFYLLGRTSPRLAVIWLTCASLVFYGWWSWHFAFLLLVSIAFNYLIGRAILAENGNAGRANALLVAGIGFNVAGIVYFKYLFPLLSFLSQHAVLHGQFEQVVLPLGISFFTFTQIGFLVECRQGFVEHEGLSEYAFFVTFFPHLISGPILQHREIVSQIRKPGTFGISSQNAAAGTALFAIGLAKKCLLADSFAPVADHGFANPAMLGSIAAWHAVLSYSMQLYFDFSGYSDMALGLAKMFNIAFPLNFNSPYKAVSVIDYWQRWNMSLTRFITRYIYNPTALWISRRRSARGLPVSRQGLRSAGGFLAMIVIPTFLTWTVAGVWHGAGLQFVVLGVLHAIYVTTNNAWRIYAAPSWKPVARQLPAWAHRAVLVVATYLAVVVGQIFFRAANVSDAMTMLRAMAGLHGMMNGIDTASPVLHALHSRLPAYFAPGAGTATPLSVLALFLPLIPFYAIVWAMPNSIEIVPGFLPSGMNERAEPHRFVWRPNMSWACATGMLIAASIASFSQVHAFIYFQF